MVTGLNNNLSITNQYQTRKNLNVQKKDVQNSSISHETNTANRPIKQPPSHNSVAFSGLFGFGPEIKDPAQNKKYQDLKAISDSGTKHSLKKLLKSGRLLNANSNDNSTVLDNLHKIATTPRHEGLDNKIILKETIKAIENPFIITQNFGNIPQDKVNGLVEFEEKLKNSPEAPEGLTTNPNSFNVPASSTCVAASMQFNLADKKPAEYARMAEGLSSEAGQVKSLVRYDNIAPGMAESLELLKDFNIPAKAHNWEKVEVTIEPDINGLVRAHIQNDDKDPGERSAVSALMQSAFMNLGSQHSYNALTDKRYGKFSTNNEGLTEFEKNFTESIVDNDSKISITYQNVDENQVLTSYNFDHKDTEKHLLDTLKSGSNIIVGIVDMDETNRIIGGHEITIIGSKRDIAGNVNFICNDTDDNYEGAIMIKSEDLIPKIHHAGIPSKLVDMPEPRDLGYQILEEYRNFNLTA